MSKELHKSEVPIVHLSTLSIGPPLGQTSSATFVTKCSEFELIQKPLNFQLSPLPAVSPGDGGAPHPCYTSINMRPRTMMGTEWRALSLSINFLALGIGVLQAIILAQQRAGSRCKPTRDEANGRFHLVALPLQTDTLRPGHELSQTHKPKQGRMHLFLKNPSIVG